MTSAEARYVYVGLAGLEPATSCTQNWIWVRIWQPLMR